MQEVRLIVSVVAARYPLDKVRVLALIYAHALGLQLAGAAVHPHHVETLHRSRANVTAHAAALEELGYDERFRRIWALYLAYCEAGFAERRIGDIQLLLTKPHGQFTSAQRVDSRSRIGPHHLAASA